MEENQPNMHTTRGLQMYKTTFGVVLLSILVTLFCVGVVTLFLMNKGMLRLSEPGVTQATSTYTVVPDVIPDVIDRVAPAVVSVVITADVPVIKHFKNTFDPFLGTERRNIGGGTGFFVSPDGYIVTNKHVVDLKDATYSIVTNDGTTYEAEVVAKDVSLDIAILRVKHDTPFPFLVFGDSNTVRLGSSVIAIGNALAELRNSVSVGVISGLSRNIIAGDGYGSLESLEGVIQTDAAINQGNSGGPLLNLNGEVIGVNVAVAGNSENIGFALPSALVLNIFESVKEYGAIVRPFIGIRYQQIDESVAKTNKLARTYGVLVVRGDTPMEVAVLPDSPAEKAGITEHDIILEFGGVKLDGTQSLGNLIRQKKVGDVVPLKVFHEGIEKEVSITLANAPAE
jgi:serine protease Do